MKLVQVRKAGLLRFDYVISHSNLSQNRLIEGIVTYRSIFG